MNYAGVTNGLHSAQLTEWRESILTSMDKPKIYTNKKDPRDSKIRDLEKDLFKKDKALAEVSALLILQKKVGLLWGKQTEGEAL